MILPYTIKNIPRPQFNSHKIEEYCDNILKELETTDKTIKIFREATKIIDKSKLDLDNRDLFKLKETNDTLLKKFRRR